MHSLKALIMQGLERRMQEFSHSKWLKSRRGEVFFASKQESLYTCYVSLLILLLISTNCFAQVGRAIPREVYQETCQDSESKASEEEDSDSKQARLLICAKARQEQADKPNRQPQNQPPPPSGGSTPEDRERRAQQARGQCERAFTDAQRTCRESAAVDVSDIKAGGGAQQTAGQNEQLLGRVNDASAKVTGRCINEADACIRECRDLADHFPDLEALQTFKGRCEGLRKAVQQQRQRITETVRDERRSREIKDSIGDSRGDERRGSRDTADRDRTRGRSEGGWRTASNDNDSNGSSHHHHHHHSGGLPDSRGHGDDRGGRHDDRHGRDDRDRDRDRDRDHKDRDRDSDRADRRQQRKEEREWAKAQRDMAMMERMNNPYQPNGFQPSSAGGMNPMAAAQAQTQTANPLAAANLAAAAMAKVNPNPGNAQKAAVANSGKAGWLADQRKLQGAGNPGNGKTSGALPGSSGNTPNASNPVIVQSATTPFPSNGSTAGFQTQSGRFDGPSNLATLDRPNAPTIVESNLPRLNTNVNDSMGGYSNKPSRRAINLADYLPNGKQYARRSPAGLESNQPEIQSQAPDIWNLISTRFRSRCAQDRLIDCARHLSTEGQ